MTIKIEITGDSIEEVADKLLALGSKLSGASTIAVAAATGQSADAEGKAKRTRKSAPTAPEQAGSTETQTSEPAAAAAETPSAPAEPAAQTESAPAAPSEAPLDFDKDVTPVVLGAVERHGREKVTEVLSQFGVARASQLDEGQWPELIAALNDIA